MDDDLHREALEEQTSELDGCLEDELTRLADLAHREAKPHPLPFGPLLDDLEEERSLVCGLRDDLVECVLKLFWHLAVPPLDQCRALPCCGDARSTLSRNRAAFLHFATSVQVVVQKMGSAPSAYTVRRRTRPQQASRDPTGTEPRNWVPPPVGNPSAHATDSPAEMLLSNFDLEILLYRQFATTIYLAPALRPRGDGQPAGPHGIARCRDGVMGVRKLIALAGVVASATLGVGAAAAPLARSDLVVVGDDGVTFDVETQTKQALVCNRGSQRARVRSRVAAEGQRTTQVRVTPDEFVLRPGRCRELTLAVSGVSVDNLDPGSVILLSRRGAAEISYTATEAASPTTATFAEALGPTKFHVQRNRWVFGPDKARLDSGLMAVRYDSAPESIPTQTVVMSDGDHVFSVEAEALDPDDAVVRFRACP